MVVAAVARCDAEGGMTLGQNAWPLASIEQSPLVREIHRRNLSACGTAHGCHATAAAFIVLS